MAATVPSTNMRMYEAAASLVGSASAGTITNSASGCGSRGGEDGAGQGGRRQGLVSERAAISLFG
jgi:hypothetical protein